MNGYFDYNASGLLRPEAAAALRAWSDGGGGNPSSMHERGRRARLAIEDARRQVAALAEGANPRDVVFTSGATESNNAALRTFASSFAEATLVVSAIDHPSLLATADALERAGHRVERLSVAEDGSPDPRDIETATEGPSLLALGLANGETGHVLDLERVLGAVGPDTFVHLDAAQAAGRIAVPFHARVDSLAVSGHKLGAPPGIGAWFVSERLRRALHPLVSGGPQEWGLRAGTPNVPGIAAMGAAAAASLASREVEAERLGALREALWALLERELGDLLRITPAGGLANTLAVAIGGCTSETMIAALDLDGFQISAGSACAAGSAEPSHVLAALGVDDKWRGSALRISAGWSTTDRDVAALVRALVRAASRARAAAA